MELGLDTIEEIFEKVFFDVEANEYTEKEVKDCFQLLLRIFSTDLGYISYALKKAIIIASIAVDRNVINIGQSLFRNVG